MNDQGFEAYFWEQWDLLNEAAMDDAYERLTVSPICLCAFPDGDPHLSTDHVKP